MHFLNFKLIKMMNFFYSIMLMCIFFCLFSLQNNSSLISATCQSSFCIYTPLEHVRVAAATTNARHRARDDAIFKKFSPDFPVYLRFVILAHILTSRKRFSRENLSKRIFKIFY